MKLFVASKANVAIGLFVAVFSLMAAIGRADETADVVLLGGKVVTLDMQNRTQQAIAVRDGKVAAVGTDAEIKTLVGKQTKVIPLEGRMVIPGIIESHSHAYGAALGELAQPFVQLRSIAEIQSYLKEQAQQLPAGRWIILPRTDITRLKERRHPTPAELDAGCSTHPVLYAVSREHVLNSLGFKMVKIDAETKSIPGVEIIRDADGKPRMLLNGTGYLNAYLPKQEFSLDEKLSGLEKLLQIYNSVGISSICERGTSIDGYKVYGQLYEQKRATTRITVTLYVGGTTEVDVEKSIAGLGVRPTDGDEWFKPGPLKIRADGGILWGSAFMREPYAEQARNFYLVKDPEFRGRMSYSVEQMTAIIRAATRLGWQTCAHITGDAGVDHVLAAVEAAAEVEPGLRERRFTLIHAYFPNGPAIAKIKQLGVCVDTQPAWYYKDADALSEVWGKKRFENFIGMKDWLAAGVPTAANTDHMIGFDPDRAFNPFNPFLTMYVMVTRKTEGGQVIGEGERISRLDALRAMTLGGAYMTFDESKLGSLEPGKLADLAILDRDYFNCPEEEIRQIKVLRTMVGGKTVFERKESQ